jgi:hypothetical protein
MQLGLLQSHSHTILKLFYSLPTLSSFTVCLSIIIKFIWFPYFLLFFFWFILIGTTFGGDEWFEINKSLLPLFEESELLWLFLNLVCFLSYLVLSKARYCNINRFLFIAELELLDYFLANRFYVYNFCCCTKILLIYFHLLLHDWECRFIVEIIVVDWEVCSFL